MGVDISMSVGVGVHVPREDLEAWLNRVDPEEEIGFYEALENLIWGGDYKLLTMDSPNNSWTDELYFQRGVVIFARNATKEFDMGREAEAGVFRFSGRTITLAEREELNAVSREITGRELKIEPLVSVGVS